MYTDDHLRHLYKTHKNFNKGNKSLQVYIKKNIRGAKIKSLLKQTQIINYKTRKIFKERKKRVEMKRGEIYQIKFYFIFIFELGTKLTFLFNIRQGRYSVGSILIN